MATKDIQNVLLRINREKLLSRVHDRVLLFASCSPLLLHYIFCD